MPRFNEEPPPLLFGFGARQRVLVALAHLGPLRLNEVLELGECHLDPILSLISEGVIVKYGHARASMVALNPEFPAAKQFRALLKALRPSPRSRRRLEAIEREDFSANLKTEDLRDLFGGWFQTASILTVAACGGEVSVEEFRRVLRFQRATSVQTTRVLNVLIGRGVLASKQDRVLIAEDFPAKKQLVTYAKALLKTSPEYDLRESMLPWIRVSVGTAPHGRINWAKDRGTAARPTGVSPAGDGTPLLFGTVTRFRVLAAIAVNGSMRPADLVRATKINQWTYQRLLNDGWLGRSGPMRGRTTRATVDLSSDLPARAEFIDLLRKMAERWPPPKIVHTPGEGKAKSLRRFEVGSCFGSQPRTETLLTLAAMGKADVSTIARAVTSTDPGSILRTFLMLESFGIVRYGESEGNARMVELDPAWFAATELRALLGALVELKGPYKGRVTSALDLMTPARRKMGENTRKRQAKAKAKTSPRVFVTCTEVRRPIQGVQPGGVAMLGIAKTPTGKATDHRSAREVVDDINTGRCQYISVANDEPLNSKRWTALTVHGTPGREVLFTEPTRDPAAHLRKKPKCRHVRRSGRRAY